MSTLTAYLDKAALGIERVAADINVWAREVSAEARAAQGELQRGSEECYGYANIPNALTNGKCVLESLKITKRMADFNADVVKYFGDSLAWYTSTIISSK